MRQRLFEKTHQVQWDTFEKQLSRLEGLQKKAPITDNEQDIHFPENYQHICQHLAIAEARAYSPLLIRQLRQLVQRGHQLLYQHQSHLGQQVIQFLRCDFPQSIRQQKNFIIAASFIFYGVGLLVAIINVYFPDFIYFFMSPFEVSNMESMYDPHSQWVGPLTRRGSDQDWGMFGYYIFNNISIAFITFASGLLCCLGTLFYLLYNAIILGAVTSHLTVNGYAHTFWPFVIGHGAFELTAITLAAAAGLKLGIAVLIPQRKTRLDAIRAAAKQAINLVLGAFIMLIIAAFIEAYWSSMNSAPAIRYSVGGLLWLAVFSYFLLAGRTRGNHEAH